MPEASTKDDIQEHFNASAAEYDTYRRFLIPNFDEFYSFGIDSLTCSEAKPRVLDLGGGTGLSTYYLLQRYPAAQVTLVDFSEDMLARAQSRFRGNPKIHYLQSDYRAITLDASFDIVISGLSIHHLTHEEKQQLIAWIYGVLTPSGEFVNADIVKGESEQIEQAAQSRLESFLRKELPEEKVQRFFASMKHDIPATVNENLTFMKQAGFTSIECLYRYWNYGIFYGKK